MNCRWRLREGKVIVLICYSLDRVLKCMAPQLMERAHLDAAEFSGRGQMSEQKNGRALASLLRLQEGIARLGVARVKVRDELVRRGS